MKVVIKISLEHAFSDKMKPFKGVAKTIKIETYEVF